MEEKILDVKQEYVKNSTHNRTMAASDSTLYAFGAGMSSDTLLTYFVSLFTPSTVVVGLINTVGGIANNIPQFFVAPKVARMERYLPIALILGLLQRVSWLVLAIATFFIAPSHPHMYLIAFFTIFGVYKAFCGMVTVPWLSLLIKIIPPQHQAAFFSIRSVTSGVAEIVGAAIAAALIHWFVFPYNYAFLFFMTFLVVMLSYIFLVRIVEFPAKKVVTNQDGVLKNLQKILTGNRNFLIYFVSTAIFVVGKGGFVFNVIYAKKTIGLTLEQAATSAVVLFVAQTIGYMVWGWVNTRWHYKYSIATATYLYIPAYVVLLFMNSIELYYLSVALGALAQAARNVGENNLAVSLCPKPEERPLYIGARNTLLGWFFAFTPLLSAWIADTFTYHNMFIFSIIFVAIGNTLMVTNVSVKHCEI